MAILREAVSAGRVLLTKDQDLGALVFRDGERHAGVLLIDDLGAASAETDLLRRTIASFAEALEAGAFVRADRDGGRIAPQQTAYSWPPSSE